MQQARPVGRWLGTASPQPYKAMEWPYRRSLSDE